MSMPATRRPLRGGRSGPDNWEIVKRDISIIAAAARSAEPSLQGAHGGRPGQKVLLAGKLWQHSSQWLT